ncbi:DNA ligase [Pokkaliibacter sp. CJK22405]|uniref:DNA ligase n=1 Tax=Pokkaliibacter sp. CJK22405 TaxID=3384615 RepID=UPI00398498AB
MSRTFRILTRTCAGLLPLSLMSLPVLAATVATNQPAAVSAKPPVMLANNYEAGVVLANYWVSEKLDGVRAYWDGEHLMTRGGYPIQAPEWFIAHFPNQPMDGELWIDRGRFAEVSGIIRQEQPDDGLWMKVKFMAYDLPGFPGNFNRRDQALGEVIAMINQPWVQHVEQQRVNNESELATWLGNVEHRGGEGLMLKRGDSLYHAKRSDDMLKYKRHEDAEATVIGYLPGKGRLKGQLGALIVRNETGQEFRLGSGLSDAERMSPPPVGSVVTYRFDGKTSSGLPRFARFLRIRPDYTPE